LQQQGIKSKKHEIGLKGEGGKKRLLEQEKLKVCGH